MLQLKEFPKGTAEKLLQTVKDTSKVGKVEVMNSGNIIVLCSLSEIDAAAVALKRIKINGKEVE